MVNFTTTEKQLGGREEEEETRELKAEMKGKPKEQEKRGQKDVCEGSGRGVSWGKMWHVDDRSLPLNSKMDLEVGPGLLQGWLRLRGRRPSHQRVTGWTWSRASSKQEGKQGGRHHAVGWHQTLPCW